MANEGTLTLILKAAKGDYTFDFNAGATKFTWTGHNSTLGTVALTTNYAAISKGAVGSIRALVVANPDTTKTISISLDGGTTDHFLVSPGMAWAIPLAPAFDVATSLRVKASSAFDGTFGFLEV
jgi:hypothetical protein